MAMMAFKTVRQLPDAPKARHDHLPEVRDKAIEPSAHLLSRSKHCERCERQGGESCGSYTEGNAKNEHELERPP
jgi:hypothetical protein